MAAILSRGDELKAVLLVHHDPRELIFMATRHHRNDLITVNKDDRKTSSISHTLVGNEFVDNSDVVGASPVGAAPTTSSFST